MFIRSLLLIAIWITPVIILTIIYLRMEKKEQEEFKNELKRPAVLFGLGIPVIGILLFFSGIISTLKLLQHVGAVFILISWFTTAFISWKKGKTGFSQSVVLIVLGMIGAGVYSYLI